MCVFHKWVYSETEHHRKCEKCGIDQEVRFGADGGYDYITISPHKMKCPICKGRKKVLIQGKIENCQTCANTGYVISTIYGGG